MIQPCTEHTQAEQKTTYPQECLTCLRLHVTELLHEIADLRKTNTRLNRRCQSAESGLAAKLSLGGPSFGRALANSAATMYRERLGEAFDMLHRAAASEDPDEWLNDGLALIDQIAPMIPRRARA